MKLGKPVYICPEYGNVWASSNTDPAEANAYALTPAELREFAERAMRHVLGWKHTTFTDAAWQEFMKQEGEGE